ncbi:MAG: murein biosynthesis integral membrane protein MurJ [Actinobacteria bacterium]|nr:murein biosynthesis integral membrane protein MurJ [Actinomycetota bacterium]
MDGDRNDAEQLARERAARLEARNERRSARGKPTYGAGGWPTDAAQTAIIAPRERDPAGAESVNLQSGTPEPQAGEAPTQGTHGRRLAVSTAIFGLATGLSRVLGLVREMVASYYFGASGRINAFTVAFQVPNLVRALVADAALSSAFVPVFSDLLEKGERRRAWRVASSLFWLMLLGLTALTALFILVAPWVIGIFGNPGHDRGLAVGLSRVLFPIVTLLGVSGIIVGILNSYDHFTVPALSPVFWNLAIIIGLAIGVPQAGNSSAKLYVYAGSILVATFIQVLLPMPWLRGLDRGEERLRVVIDWHDPAVKRVFKLMIPVTLGLGLINVNAVIDTFFAARLIDPDLAPTAIQKAFLIYMLPQGMFSVAIATVLFPTLSRLASRGDLRGFAAAVSNGLRQIAFLLAPTAVVSAVLAEPIVRLLYQRGHWHPPQTPVVAGALAAFSAGLVFNGAMLMLNRAFFSLQSNWVPTTVALGNLFLNAVLDFAFYRVGVWGIPLATAVSNVVATVALVILLRRRLGRIGGSEIALSLTKIIAASALVALVSWFVWHPLDGALGRSFPAQVVSLGAALLLATAVYFAACRALKVREMQALLSLRGRLSSR